jgi:hypothetical protein
VWDGTTNGAMVVSEQNQVRQHASTQRLAISLAPVIRLRADSSLSSVKPLFTSPFCCTTLLHHFAAPLCCTTLLHHFAAPLCCTTLLHHFAAPLHLK